MKMKKQFSIEIGSNKLKGIIENPSATKLIILVHGFTGDWRGPNNIFITLSQELQQEGYAVLRFSFLGVSPSEGEYVKMTVESQTNELQRVISYALTLGYEKIGILGESMGGTVVTSAYHKQLATVVYWYPVFNFFQCSFSDFYKPDAQEELKENGFVLVDGYKVGKKFIDQIPIIDVYNNIKKITSPVLFLHGDSDTDVPLVQSEKAFEIAHSPKEIHLIKGANHCFEHEHEKVIKLTVSFIKRFC